MSFGMQVTQPGLTSAAADAAYQPLNSGYGPIRAALSGVTLTDHTLYVATDSGSCTIPAGTTASWGAIANGGTGTLTVGRSGSDTFFYVTAGQTSFTIDVGQYREWFWDGTQYFIY